MASVDEQRFCTTGPTSVPPSTLLPLALADTGPESPHVHTADDGIVFDTDGWYEVLLRVDWSTASTEGSRFSHTKIPEQEPLHSEAIDAEVLAEISGGRQLLRGNSLFGPNRTTSLVLEVWHDAPTPLAVTYAELVVRELTVPWPATS